MARPRKHARHNKKKKGAPPTKSAVERSEMKDVEEEVTVEPKGVEPEAVSTTSLTAGNSSIAVDVRVAPAPVAASRPLQIAKTEVTVTHSVGDCEAVTMTVKITTDETGAAVVETLTPTVIKTSGRLGAGESRMEEGEPRAIGERHVRDPSKTSDTNRATECLLSREVLPGWKTDMTVEGQASKLEAEAEKEKVTEAVGEPKDGGSSTSAPVPDQSISVEEQVADETPGLCGLEENSLSATQVDCHSEAPTFVEKFLNGMKIYQEGE